ncbi:integrase, catalytic region, zinc finger, CCHC-type containing protein [Tanacetum coccineum]
MNYLEEQTDGEAMINSIQNGDHPLPVVTQVSLVGTTSNVSPPLKDKSIKTKENQGDVNDAMGYKKKAVVVTSDPLALVAEKIKVSKRKKKVVVQSEFEGGDDEDISDLKKITALLAKAFNRKKYYAKPTNNNLRTSSASSSANKKLEYVKSEEKKKDKKADEKKRDMSKVKCYNCKKEGHFAKDCKKAKVKDYNYYMTKMLLAKKNSDEQVPLAEDQAWMESSSDSDQEINANMVFIAKMEKVLSDSEESSSSVEETFAEVSYYTSDSKSEFEYETSEYYDNSTNYDHDQSKVDHNDSEDKDHLVYKLIKKFNHNIAKCQKCIKKASQQSKDLENQNKDLQDKYDVLKNQKNIDEQEILFDKISRQLVEMNNNVLRLQEKILELEECVRNKDLEIEKCLERLNDCENKLHKIGQTRQTIHMIMPFKDKMYNGRQGIGFENPSYFCKAKDLRPSLYDERVISLGYPPMFLTYSNEALEIEIFKRARENKIEFAYDYGNLNASYVNKKINFLDDYFQEIIIDLEDEVVSLLEKEKENLEIIESLKSKGFESSENAISELENQSENDCQEVEKDLDTLSSVRRPKHSDVIWKKKGSSNTSNVDLSFVSHSKLNKDVKRYSRKDLLSCNNFHHKDTRSACACNDVMNVSCNSRLYASCDVNDLFVFDDVSIRKSQVSKMPFRKKPRDSLNVHSRSNSNKSLPRTVFRWLPKMQPLAEPVAKWISKIVQICLWIIDSGCSKHITGNRALWTNFVEKFFGMVRFGNNDFAVIAGYGDVVLGSMTIKKVYYVKGLGHNLFSVGQFCVKGLEVAFRKSTCFVRNEDGVDLLASDRSSNLYTIALNEITSNSLACLLAKASSSQSWLWHQRLSHLNFATINKLAKNNLVLGLPKMKFKKDHLCSACEQGKMHRKHHKSKTAFASNQPLYLLHMDLCGPMRVKSINGKRYVLVVVDDYSGNNGYSFLHSKR